jgi:hypothetical protein
MPRADRVRRLGLAVLVFAPAPRRTGDSGQGMPATAAKPGRGAAPQDRDRVDALPAAQ